MNASYPPPPWRLGGQLLVSAFKVPVSELPPHDPPPGFHAFRLGGDAIVGVAFASYTPTGVLAYDELLVGIGGVWRGRPVTHIPQIWVDSPQSLAGGRELWGIPKELADFGGGGRPIARMTARTGAPLLPGLRRVPLLTAQREFVSTNLVLARVRHLRARWDFDPQGPLAWMRGRRPTLSAALLDATIVFGTERLATRTR